jgi:two-component system, OmpR family, sensor kinase
MTSLFRRITRRIPPLHIGTFIGILHLFIGILGAGVITAFSLYFIYQSGEQANLREVEDLAFITENAIEEPVRAFANGTGSVTSIEAALNRYLKSHPEVRYTILAPDGNALLPGTSSCSLTDLSLNSPEVKVALTNTIGHSIRNCPAGTRMIYVASKIDQGANFFGILVLAAPFDGVMAPTYQTMRWMGVIALLIVAFTVGEGWLGSIYISGPLTRLSLTAEKLSKGDLSARAKVEGPVEVIHLAKTLNEMAARLQTSLDSLRAFVANASHELRTPLTSIKLQVGALRECACEEPEIANRFMDQLDHEIDRLAYTVNDMLDLSQIEGATENHFQIVNLIDLASEVEAFWEVRSRQSGLVLTTVASKDLFPVKGDPYQLRRLFDNLLDNAIKNTPAGGKVEMLLQNCQEENSRFQRAICIVIRDTGRGIAPEHLPHIFDRFYRIDPHPRGERGGSGLGLAIVHSIVIVHGGNILVDSALGSGTSFHIELPVS